MTKQAPRSEADLARELNEKLQSRLKSKRLASILLSGSSVLAAAVCGLLGFAMEAFCLFVVALILLLRYFDTNGHLHEVRHRSTKTLFPRLSKLQRKDQSASSNPGQSLSQG